MEKLKGAEKDIMVQSMQKMKRQETQIRDLKGRLLTSDNCLLKKDKEIEFMRKVEVQRAAAEEKYTIRDRQTFENHFGHKPRAQEEKYVIFLRMYENQAERYRKQLNNLELEKMEMSRLLEKLNGNS